MGNARAITKNAFYIFVSNVTQKLLHLVFVAGAARLLGAQGYGQFLLVTTMVLLVTAFANFGIRPLIVRMISREKERTGEVLSNVLLLRSVLGTLLYAALVAFVYAADYSSEVRLLAVIGGLAIVFNVIQDSFEAVLIAHQRMKLLGGLSVFYAFTGGVVGLGVLWFGLGLRWLFVSNVAVNVLYAAVMAGVIWLRVVRFRPRLEAVVMKTLLVGCLPFLVAFLLGSMDIKVDILMLSLMKGPVDSNLAIGYYGPAHTILLAAMMLPRSLNQVLIPVVSQKIYVDQAAVREVVERATKFVMLAVSFPIILATTLFSGEIVAIAFGSQYAPTAKALLILGWAYGFYALNLPAQSVLGSTKEVRYFLPVLGGLFVLNIALDYLLIPRYSYVGAAMGSLVVLALGFCSRFYILRKILQMPLSETWRYAKPFLALLLTLAVGFAVRPYLPWLVVAVVMASAYGGLLFGLRVVDPDEWRFVVGLLGKRFGGGSARTAGTLAVATSGDDGQTR